MGFTNPYPASRLTLDSTASINSGLVAFYPLTDETSSTALDISGNYHNGTMTNGAYFTGSTGIGRCAFFDGSNDYCTTGNAALSINGSVGTISFWFKSNASQTGARLFEFGSSSSTGRSIGVLVTSSGDVTFRYRQSSTNSDVTGPALSSLGSGWNFAVATWDASNNINLYINGTKYTGLRTGSINVGNLDRGYIAERALEVPLGKAFQGEMQNVRCWTVELSQAQVDLLYARPWEGTNYGDIWPYSPPAAGSMTVDSSNSLVTGMNAWFPLTEAGGTSAQCILHPSHVGTLQGDAAFVSSEIGGALSCSGISQSGVDVPTNPASSVPITVSAWFKTSNTSSDMYIIDGDDSSDRIAIYRNTSGTLIAYAGGSCFFGTSNSVIADGNWHHVAAVCTSSAITVYFDGVQDGTGSAATNSISGFRIGARFSISSNWDGELQNVRTYNRALSATEVATLYHRPWEGIEYGDTFHHDPPAPASMLPLTSDAINTDQVGWWPLTETDDYASGAADISGSSSTGTKSGGVTSQHSFTGASADFDNTGHIDVGKSFWDSGVVSANAFTFNAWFNVDNNTADHGIFGSWNSASEALNVWVDVGGTNVSLTAICGDGTTQAITSVNAPIVTIGQWHMGTVIFDGSANTLKVYLDGIYSNENSSATATLTTAPMGFHIGDDGSTSRTTEGLIQNCRLWSRVLTADEIWSIYANPWLGSNYKLASGSTPLYNYIFRSKRFRRLS